VENGKSRALKNERMGKKARRTKKKTAGGGKTAWAEPSGHEAAETPGKNGSGGIQSKKKKK